MDVAPENTSGQDKSAIIPQEIQGWNWGAFFLGWIWGVGNNVWIALLQLIPIPFFDFIWAIVLGVKGNGWAWRKKKWDSIEHFKSTQRKWGIAGVAVFIVSVIIILIAIVVPADSPVPSSTPTLQPESAIEEGWVRLRIQDVGSIDYPTDFLELQSGDYQYIVEKWRQVLGLSKSDFTLQQVGLNELKPSAFEEYRRVILQTSYLNPGEEVFRVNEKYSMSQQELAEFQNELIDQLNQEYAKGKSMGLGDNKIIDPGTTEIVEVNGMFPLVHTYKRQLNDNPVVLVKTYLFWNYDRIHSLAFSCRVEDEEECGDIYGRILASFRLKGD